MGRKGILARIKWEKEHSNYKAFLHPDYSFLKIKFSEVCVFCLCEIKVLNFYESDSKGDVFFNNIFRYTRPSAILVLNCPVTKVTICHDTSSTFWTFTLHYVITNNTASPPPLVYLVWQTKLLPSQLYMFGILWFPKKSFPFPLLFSQQKMETSCSLLESGRPCGKLVNSRIWPKGHFLTSWMHKRQFYCILAQWKIHIGAVSHLVRNLTALKPPCCEETQISSLYELMQRRLQTATLFSFQPHKRSGARKIQPQTFWKTDMMES